jgi:nitrous oxidase accessory protein NosD
MKRGLRLLSIAVALTMLLGLPSPALAATLIVDDNNAECPTATYTTIQAAVIDADPGDTIQVCAGTYPEPAPGPLTINKMLTLEGAQSGVDARSPRGPESIITDPQGTGVTASSVVIDGFTVQDSISPASQGSGYGSVLASAARRS